MLPVQPSVQRHLSVLHAPGSENPCSEVIKVNAISGIEFRGDLEPPAHHGKTADFWQFVQFARERSIDLKIASWQISVRTPDCILRA